jgi:hypothetical protein
MKKLTAALVSGIFTIGIFSLCTLTACDKNDDCFSDVVKARHQNDICPTDCPGVTGCDGKRYCNKCEANKAGIMIVND